MTAAAKPSQCIIRLFEQQPCWQIQPLARELDYSIPSVRRFLFEVGYHGSFTHNGMWYTLGSIPKFDRDGLWFNGEIGFSRAGSLTKTLINLAGRSLAGMSAEELGEKLHCRCHSILVTLCRKGRLDREKAGRAYVYLAGNPNDAKRQRQRLLSPPVTPKALPAEIAVLILAEFIRKPESSFADLDKAITQSRGISVGASQIERLFADQGLKKTH